MNDALSKNVILTEKVRKLEEVLKGVRNGSNILSVLPSTSTRMHPSDTSRESSSSVTPLSDSRDARKRDLSPSVRTTHLLRSNEVKLGIGGTVKAVKWLLVGF